MNINAETSSTIITAATEAAGYTYIKLNGRMVYEHSHDYSQKLAEYIADKRSCIVDVDEVERIDSTGLGVLIGFAKRVQGAGGQLAFIVNKEFMLEIFKIAKFDSVFPVVSNREEGWAVLQDGYQAKLTLKNY